MMMMMMAGCMRRNLDRTQLSGTLPPSVGNIGIASACTDAGVVFCLGGGVILCGDDDDDDDDDGGVHAQECGRYAAERDAASLRGQYDGAELPVRSPAVLRCYCVLLTYE